MNTLKEDREQVSLVDKYSWLGPEDERRNMTDRENIGKIHQFGDVVSE